MSERFRKSYETQALEAKLRTLPIGETITYETMANVIGAPVDGSTQALSSARDILEREGGYVFATITRIGVKRLADSDIVTETEESRRKIARKAKTAMRRLANVQDFSSMTDEEKRRHQAYSLIYASIAEKASSQSAANEIRIARTDGASHLMLLKSALQK